MKEALLWTVIYGVLSFGVAYFTLGPFGHNLLRRIDPPKDPETARKRRHVAESATMRISLFVAGGVLILRLLYLCIHR